MAVVTYTMNQTLVLTVDGELNNQTVEDIRPIIDAFIQRHQDVLVDINSVGFIDSSGIGALVYLYKQLQQSGRKMRLICKEGQPRDLLSILHIDRTIQCYTSICDFLHDSAKANSMKNNPVTVAV